MRYILPAILAGTMLLLLGLVRADAQEPEPVCGEWVKIRDGLKEKAGMVEVAGRHHQRTDGCRDTRQP